MDSPATDQTPAAAVLALAPEPEWITRAADERGWAWARIAWNRAAAQTGAWFDEAKADKIVQAWPKIFRHTEGRWAGKPFYLAVWQEVIVRLLVGWKKPVEKSNPGGGVLILWVRVFRELRLWIPRKAGKSEFMAALALLFWVIEGVPGAQGFCFARDENQGRVVFSKMATMLAQHPLLSKPEKVRRLKKSLWAPEIRATFELLSGKPDGKHGRSPVVSVGDEMHEWFTRDLATTLRQGMGAHDQPMELYASTAGLKTAVVGYEMYEESVAILEGRIDDPTILICMFVLGDDEDWTDEKNLARVNPNIGTTPTWEFIRREMALAKERPSHEASFRRYHANQWIDAIEKAIPVAVWDACVEDRTAWKTRFEALRGRRCYLGFDLSSTRDITALVAWFDPEDGEEKTQLLAKFWCPEEAVDRRSRVDRLGYERWAKKMTPAAITPTPGNMVDQSFVLDELLKWCDHFDVRGIGYDPFYSTKLITDAQASGVPAETFVRVRQGHLTLSEPWRKFEELVFTSLLDHGGHPVLRWMAGNVALRPDVNMNLIPDKKKSAEKIDGVAAALNAYAASLAGDPGPTTTGADIMTVC